MKNRFKKLSFEEQGKAIELSFKQLFSLLKKNKQIVEMGGQKTDLNRLMIKVIKAMNKRTFFVEKRSEDIKEEWIQEVFMKSKAFDEDKSFIQTACLDNLLYFYCKEDATLRLDEVNHDIQESCKGCSFYCINCLT